MKCILFTSNIAFCPVSLSLCKGRFHCCRVDNHLKQNVKTMLQKLFLVRKTINKKKNAQMNTDEEITEKDTKCNIFYAQKNDGTENLTRNL